MGLVHVSGPGLSPVLSQRGAESNEVVVEVDVHGFAHPVLGVVGGACPWYPGRAPLSFQRLAVENRQVCCCGSTSGVVIFLQVEVDLGVPEANPGPSRPFFVRHDDEAKLFIVRERSTHVRGGEARSEPCLLIRLDRWEVISHGLSLAPRTNR
jgi:hypothetical protein